MSHLGAALPALATPAAMEPCFSGVPPGNQGRTRCPQPPIDCLLVVGCCRGSRGTGLRPAL